MAIRPVFQTIISNVNGDCERACVATITGIPIEEVPNFADEEVRKQFDLWLPLWLESRGFCLIQPKQDLGAHDYTYLGLNGMAAIATVPSQMFPDCKHAIVVGWRDHPEYEGALECYVVHDPNPRNAPYEDVHEVIERLRWIVPRALGAA